LRVGLYPPFDFEAWLLKKETKELIDKTDFNEVVNNIFLNDAFTMSKR